MKKKILTLGLVVALLTVAVISGTMAYFTDTEDATNTFTVGNVDITLDEAEVEYDEDTEEWEALDTRTEDGNAYEDIFPGVKLPKDPTVTNTGSYDAYVRVDITVSKNALLAFGADNGSGLTIFNGFKQIVTGGIMSQTFVSTKQKDNGIADGLINDDYLLAFAPSGDDIVFTVYKLDPLAAEDAFTVFEYINVPSALDNDDIEKIVTRNDADDRYEFEIEVNASAIQEEGFVDDDTKGTAAAQAFAALANQMK